jgi:hypothetical protein
MNRKPFLVQAVFNLYSYAMHWITYFYYHARCTVGCLWVAISTRCRVIERDDFPQIPLGHS